MTARIIFFFIACHSITNYLSVLLNPHIPHYTHPPFSLYRTFVLVPNTWLLPADNNLYRQRVVELLKPRLCRHYEEIECHNHLQLINYRIRKSFNVFFECYATLGACIATCVASATIFFSFYIYHKLCLSILFLGNFYFAKLITLIRSCNFSIRTLSSAAPLGC